MKKTIVLVMAAIVILFISNCTSTTNKESKMKKSEASKLTENFDWLLGSWKRNNEEAGKETFEIWNKTNSYEYIGLGFTMQNGDTIKQEKIKLIKLNGKWNLEVKVPEETESIIFKVSNFDNKGFTCENEVIDFPKKIKYWKNGDKINALVSGEDMEITFEFEKAIEE